MNITQRDRPQNKPLHCPNCASDLQLDIADYNPNRIRWYSDGGKGDYFPFKGYRALQCPCCNFWVDNSESDRCGWDVLRDRAIALGATEQIPEWAREEV